MGTCEILADLEGPQVVVDCICLPAAVVVSGGKAELGECLPAEVALGLGSSQCCPADR